ncbi:MAG: hypothetical protein COA73_04310 [Candidatus Hydrogenedentota bacterium]|nr:MAG: hypothetical protein COA73_04310 [Candidatus Hydrogenedentota bacterium]
MSLKAFHLVFIAISTIMAVGFGGWCIAQFFTQDGGAGYIVSGILSALAGAGLVVYGIRFARKWKDVSFI